MFTVKSSRENTDVFSYQSDTSFESSQDPYCTYTKQRVKLTPTAAMISVIHLSEAYILWPICVKSCVRLVA